MVRVGDHHRVAEDLQVHVLHQVGADLGGDDLARIHGAHQPLEALRLGVGVLQLLAVHPEGDGLGVQALQRQVGDDHVVGAELGVVAGVDVVGDLAAHLHGLRLGGVGLVHLQGGGRHHGDGVALIRVGVHVVVGDALALGIDGVLRVLHRGGVGHALDGGLGEDAGHLDGGGLAGSQGAHVPGETLEVTLGGGVLHEGDGLGVQALLGSLSDGDVPRGVGAVVLHRDGVVGGLARSQVLGGGVGLLVDLQRGGGGIRGDDVPIPAVRVLLGGVVGLAVGDLLRLAIGGDGHIVDDVLARTPLLGDLGGDRHGLLLGHVQLAHVPDAVHDLTLGGVGEGGGAGDDVQALQLVDLHVGGGDLPRRPGGDGEGDLAAGDQIGPLVDALVDLDSCVASLDGQVHDAAGQVRRIVHVVLHPDLAQVVAVARDALEGGLEHALAVGAVDAHAVQVHVVVRAYLAVLTLHEAIRRRLGGAHDVLGCVGEGGARAEGAASVPVAVGHAVRHEDDVRDGRVLLGHIQGVVPVGSGAAAGDGPAVPFEAGVPVQAGEGLLHGGGVAGVEDLRGAGDVIDGLDDLTLGRIVPPVGVVRRGTPAGVDRVGSGLEPLAHLRGVVDVTLEDVERSGGDDVEGDQLHVDLQAVDAAHLLDGLASLVHHGVEVTLVERVGEVDQVGDGDGPAGAGLIRLGGEGGAAGGALVDGRHVDGGESAADQERRGHAGEQSLGHLQGKSPTARGVGHYQDLPCNRKLRLQPGLPHRDPCEIQTESPLES